MSGFPPPPPEGTGAWTTGLCGCFGDCSGCLVSFCCPCVAIGQIAETIDRGNTSCGMAGAIYCALISIAPLLAPWIYSCTFRSKLRAAYGLPAEPCADGCVHLCCEPCAISQMYRELKNRGVNPAAGWGVNSQKFTSAPVPMQDMKR